LFYLLNKNEKTYLLTQYPFFPLPLVFCRFFDHFAFTSFIESIVHQEGKKKSPASGGRFNFGKFISGDSFSKPAVSHIEWIDHSRHRDSPGSVAESLRITPDAPLKIQYRNF